MNADAVFNRYDIRGNYPAEIDEAFARRIGKAVGTWTQQNSRGQVVVGRDTRDTSAAVYDAVVDGARSTGANVVDVGAGPTDRVALAAAHYGGTGIMVTASHHDWQRTGFKLIYEQGNGFTNDDREAVRDVFQSQSFEQGSGAVLREQHEFDEIYIDKAATAVSEIVENGIDAQVLLDTAGAAGRTAAAVLQELGATVEEYERDRQPAPEPTAENRAGIVDAAGTADIALGYDPDGDRVYAVHPDLGWIDGDRMLYALGRITEADTVVASLDTSPMVEELDAAVEYARVGDVFVADRGIEVDADLLGEPNGHYAVPAFSWYNSGTVTSALLAAYADRLPALLASVADYRSIRRTAEFETAAERDDAFEVVKKQVAQQYDVVSRVDGVKFTGHGMTGLVRPSGTAPKLRAVFHAAGGDVDLAAAADRLL